MLPRDETRLDDFLDRPRRAIWVVAAPMMGGFAVHALYVITDTVFVGRLGSDALAAITFVGALFFFAIALVNGLATGITATVAQAIGRRDQEDASRLASGGLGLGLAGGLLMGLTGFLGADAFLPWLGAGGEALVLAEQYFLPLAIGLPIFFVSGSMRAVLTGEGDAKTPMMVLGISTLLNIGLDPLFIFVFDWGIRGATLATLAAQVFSLVAFVWLVLVRRKTHARFTLKHLVPRRELVLAIARIGLPAALAMLVMAIGSGLVNRVLSHFGQEAVAGYGAGSRVDMLIALPVMGLGAGAVTVIGMLAGARHGELVRSTALYSVRWAILLATSIGVIAFAGSEQVIRLFTDDPLALEIGRGYLAFMVFAYPLMAFGMTSGRILLGLGLGVPSLIITLLRVLVVTIPVAYVSVYAFHGPITCVWSSFILGGVVSNAVALWWIREYLWRRDPTERVAAKITVEPG